MTKTTEKRGRTLMYDVAALVIRKKQATVEDIAPSFPEKTAYQLRKALHNAVAKGIIRVVHNGHQAGVHGRGSATYGPRDAKTIGAVAERSGNLIASSVFDMVGVRLSESRGTVHSPLGGWA